MKLVATDHSVQALEEYGTQYLTLDGFGHNKNEAFGSEDCSLSAASSSSSSSLRSSSSIVGEETLACDECKEPKIGAHA
ncbi:hypothetical protein CUMW_082830 [Citrus unshiu]|nr:hypothetical protein CUMW_082830 [Citrus unshiu]GAY44554.1 hypothetical protein CUMW_082830 [Citrus unshiu]